MNGDGEFLGIFRELSQANLIEVGLILLSALGSIFIIQRHLPWLSKYFYGRIHYYLLAMVPLLRLVIILVAFGMIVPRLIEPTFENMVALLGAFGLAVGFAFKDYASSLVAGIVTLYEMPLKSRRLDRSRGYLRPGEVHQYAGYRNRYLRRYCGLYSSSQIVGSAAFQLKSWRTKINVRGRFLSQSPSRCCPD